VQRIAVITGGSSGIGAAIARRLTERGWQCVLLARTEERLRGVAEEIGAEWKVCDVGDRAAVERVATEIRGRHPAIHLLVCNAGIPGRTGFLTAEPERIEDVMRVNYLGALWCVRAFLPALEGAAGPPSPAPAPGGTRPGGVAAGEKRRLAVKERRSAQRTLIRPARNSVLIRVGPKQEKH